MVLPRPPYNPNQPIPNDPFTSPRTNYLDGPLGPLIIGSGLDVSVDGVLTATGGGGGAVTSIVAGTNITISSTGGSPGTGTVTINANLAGLVTAVNVTPPLVSTGGTAPTLSVLPASTTQFGVTQLYNNTDSTATNLALTAAQGRALQLQIDAISTGGGLTFAGTINATTGNLTSVSTTGAGAGFVAGNALPNASAPIADYFVVVTTAGSFTPPGGVLTAFNNGDWVLCTGVVWERVATGATFSPASTTAAGIVELATDAETQTGTDATRAVTPASLQSKVSDSVSTSSATSIASSNAVKMAYDLANAALPLAGGTMTGTMTFVNNQPVDAGTY
jgi:hypothetical protein